MRAMVRLRTRLGDPDLSASQLLLMLAERELERGDQDDVVAPPRGENAYREQYRIIEHRCPECDRAWTEGRGGRHEMTKATRTLVECDAETVQGDPEHDRAGHVTRTIPPAIRRAVLVRDNGKWNLLDDSDEIRRHVSVQVASPTDEWNGPPPDPPFHKVHSADGRP